MQVAEHVHDKNVSSFYPEYPIMYYWVQSVAYEGT
jgi:hypothetical protein